ncbi:MAG: peptidase T [Prolixibacteraceae bacterium]|nr:peptidase T [Prolixibacteraceae bacterium]
MEKVVERFLKYISADTHSDPKSGLHPSTNSQLEFSKKIAKELEEIGLVDVSANDKAYIYATLPSNIDRKVPVVGFIAHMDSSPDFNSEGIKPQFIEKYDGNDIVLNKEQNIVMSIIEFPELLNFKGQTLITTDGTTLLSADDKAGMAEIVTAIEYLINHPEIKHGEVRIGFTPDEEIGEGADFFDIRKFNAEFAYTIDGDDIGVIEYENFNAASAKVIIKGKSIHPGNAKGKMINSLLAAQKFLSMLPEKEVPEHTEGYEGFYHLTELSGNIEKTEMQFIIRDHSKEIFDGRKQKMQNISDSINKLYGQNIVELTLKDQYYNMLEKIEPVKYVVDIAVNSMKECGITPVIKPIRGGTDGARLSYMGLPCPNIFTGGINMHGPYELISVESMKKAAEVIIKIIQKVSDLKD